MSKIIQDISKSLIISKWTKENCYGHYCNLCKKYNYNRLTFKQFKPADIMAMEYKFLNEKRSRQVSSLAQLYNE